ncbi:tRNA lysidine(34) synthetase TilS [Sphingomicrobium clamense]|uniref:tRNA(Ile)-lysidine synthase n=1 Tax=Sphingomicrobium clamense TaxID=2851013 RepID=A0ABS6V416_9SPHN|nr:tRNA lysidine(34) synthetase TilS [Sphingomicrobium sp. B8]MBW0144298.1 tRNA lysidine(34) synthetase TilS [Sphingomicrobium sp. B8]
MSEVDRFADDLARLTQPDERIGLAVSGGPDSLALLLLAHRAVPDRIAVATVDHGLRPEAKQEAADIAELCAERGIAHDTLNATWDGDPPTANIQAEARAMRYRLLGEWAAKRGLRAVATAHHRDDVVETLLMRAMRGAGVGGLAAMPDSRPLRDDVRLIRPLLGWSRDELADIVRTAGIRAVDDPSNSDPAHDRSRLRTALDRADLGDLSALASSASHLRQAEDALDWTATRLADRRLRETEDGWALVRGTIPDELLRRLLLIGFERMGDRPPRGPDLERAMSALEKGGKCTLGTTLLAADGDLWTLSPAPPRKR